MYLIQAVLLFLAATTTYAVDKSVINTAMQPGAPAGALAQRTAFKQEYYVEILRSKNERERIGGLTWQTNRVAVETSGSGLNTLIFVRPIGKMADVHQGLVYKGLRVRFAPDGRFRFKIPINGPYTVFNLTSVTPEGQVIEEKIVLRFPRWKEFKSDFIKKKFNLNFSVGFTYLNYIETDQEVPSEDVAFSEFAISTKLAGFYMLIPGVLDLGMNVFINALPFGSNNAGYTIRMFGANGRLGWVVPFVERPLRLSLMVGWYYFSSFSTKPETRTVDFGVANMSGPQIFPLLNIYTNSGWVLSYYFKFSPVASITRAVYSLANREIATGIGFVKPVGTSGNVISINLDYSQLDLALEEADALEVVHHTGYHAKSITLSLGYGF